MNCKHHYPDLEQPDEFEPFWIVPETEEKTDSEQKVLNEQK